MYLLYHHPMSQHSRRVVALLEIAGLQFDARIVVLESNEHRSADYLAINPNHQVPTLVDGALVLHESNAILRYLCLKHGLSDWYPVEPAARAMVEQWLDWNQCRLAPAVFDIVFNKVVLGDTGDSAAIARGEASWTELEPILEAALRDRPWLGGARPCIADLSVASNLDQLAMAGIRPRAEPSRLWLDRVRALPGVQAALAGLQPVAA